MKTYVFLTFDIQNSGGGQCYVAGKAKFLEDDGWRVLVFSGGYKNRKKCRITYLDKFCKYRFPEMMYPPFFLLRNKVERKLSWIESVIGRNHDEIILESHDDSEAQWGELIGLKCNARHVVVPLVEEFTLPSQHYREKLDFYSFKYKRKELFGSVLGIQELFKNYLTIDADKVETFLIDEDPIQDVISEKIDKIQKLDYNVCYIGRADKHYVPSIIRETGIFAGNHQDKRVQLIMVGDETANTLIIQEVKHLYSNLSVVELGDLYPLPRSIYKKTDVVIAGSGSARHSAEEGALVIVADHDTCKSNGLLGYETMESVNIVDQSKQTTFDIALERVLVERIQDKLTNNYPQKIGVMNCTKQNFDLIKKSDKRIFYYDKDKLLEGPVNWRLVLTMPLMKLNAYTGIGGRIKKALLK